MIIHGLQNSLSLSNAILHSFTSLFKFPSHLSFSFKFKPTHSKSYSISVQTGLNSASLSSNSFTWDDVLRVGQLEPDPSDLSGFFDKIKACNRNAEKQCEFVPFVLEDQTVGYIHHGFAYHLRKFQDVFQFPQGVSYNGHFGHFVTLHPALKSPEDRTLAVGAVINCLGEEVVPGIRNELFPVSSRFGKQVFFSIERAAVPYFGTKAYGVQINGYVESGGQKFLWLGKRSQAKPKDPGTLDGIAAGGLPHGISCSENAMKECEEEAGIVRPVSQRVEPAGAFSYMDIDGYKCRRHVLFCYDLKLPESFIPSNQDGDLESFRLIPVPCVANAMKRTDFFKPASCIAIIDFLFRHGYICPEHAGYLELLGSLRSGDLS